MLQTSLALLLLGSFLLPGIVAGGKRASPPSGAPGILQELLWPHQPGQPLARTASQLPAVLRESLPIENGHAVPAP